MKLRRIILFLVILALGFLVMTHLGQFREFTTRLKQANLFILAFIILARYLYYWSNAKYFVVTFRTFDFKLSFRRAIRAAIIYNFLNAIIPSGGVSGASYIAREFHDDVKASVATAVQIAWYFFTYTSYFILLFIGLVSLLYSNQLVRLNFRVGVTTLALITGFVILSFVVIINRELTKKIVWKIFIPLNWLLKKFKRAPISQPKINQFIQEFYDSFGTLLRTRKNLGWSLWYCFLGLFAEVASIYIVFLSLGQVVNPGVVIAGYGLAMAFSTVAFFSGGVGVYEAVMTATFVALGEPFSIAFAAVIIYRVIALWLFIPIGLHFYHQRSTSENGK